MEIRQLSADDAAGFKALRILAVREFPASFYPRPEEVEEMPLTDIARQIAPSELNAVFGAFDGDRLIAIAGIRRDPIAKVRHKMYVWGVYTHPDYRRRGIAQGLIEQLLSMARSIPEVVVVKLTAGAENGAARALYESFGFTIFGVEPKAMFVDGVYFDEVHMAIDLDKNPVANS